MSYYALFTQNLHTPLYSNKSIKYPTQDTATRLQILDQPNCISHSTNTLEKGMNPIIPPPAMSK